LRAQGITDERSLAQILRADRYPATCRRHGETLFWTRRARCATCFGADGAVRRRVPLLANRLAARDAGEATYFGWCRAHGRVPFHTVRGKCLSCFNTLGQPRKKPLTPSG